MFPVHTGINRRGVNWNTIDVNVPCVHRDKPPPANVVARLNACSLLHTGIKIKLLQTA